MGRADSRKILFFEILSASWSQIFMSTRQEKQTITMKYSGIGEIFSRELRQSF